LIEQTLYLEPGQDPELVAISRSDLSAALVKCGWLHAQLMYVGIAVNDIAQANLGGRVRVEWLKPPRSPVGWDGVVLRAAGAPTVQAGQIRCRGCRPESSDLLRLCFPVPVSGDHDDGLGCGEVRCDADDLGPDVAGRQADFGQRICGTVNDVPKSQPTCTFGVMETSMGVTA
jgi:hypothetical protein